MRHVYSSIDIGSDTIKIVVCEYNLNKLNLLAATETESKGIKKGLITNPKETIVSIKKALKEIEDMLGVRIEKTIATIPSYQVKYKIIKGSVEVLGDIITHKDMGDCYKIGIKNNLTLNQEFVNIVPIDFQINDKTIMKNPDGFPANKLLGRAMMITSPQKNIYSVASALESIGIDIADITVTSVGDISLFKNQKIENQIGAIINIGSEITTVSLYNRAVPVNTKIINMGGQNIDSDIAYMYKIDINEAKKIKEKFALASRKNANFQDIYETINQNEEKIKINQLELSEIVMSRVEEILSLAKNEINLLTNRQIQYIIVTGGVSNSQNIETTIKHVLGQTATTGKIKIIGVRNNKYSTALGNIIYYINSLKLKGKEDTMLTEEDMEILSSPDKHFINTNNETMLGKVFGYFFGE